MKRIFSRVIAITLTIVSVAGAAHCLAQSEPLTIGVVPQFSSRQIYSNWQPILDELETKTGLRFRLKGAQNIPDFEKKLLSGKFDFAYVNPYHFLRAHHSQGYLPLVRDVGRTLSGILVTRKDSDIKDISDLHNKRVAFPAPNALGASLLPRADLKNIYNASIEPVYVQSHSSVYLTVVMGRAAAGGGVKKSLARQPENIKDKLRVIYHTRESVPHPLVAHPRVSESVRENVRQAMLDLGKTAEGQKLLAKIPIDTIGTAAVQDYQELQNWGLEHFYVSN